MMDLNLSSLATLLAAVVVLSLIAINAKSLPFVYTLRLLPSLYRLFWPRLSTTRPPRVQDLSPASPIATHPALFKHHTTSSRAVLTDLDPNLHKSNSTFFADADINRAALLTHLLSNGLMTAASAPAVPILAAAQCRFQREIAPFQAYDISSRVLAWGDKSLFTVTYFLRRGTKLPAREVDGGPGCVLGDKALKSNVYAILVSRYVIKAGRETVLPRNLLTAAGLLLSVEKGLDDRLQGVGELLTTNHVDRAIENGLRYVRECML